MSYKVYIYDRHTKEAIKVLVVENETNANKMHALNEAAIYGICQPATYYTENPNEVKITEATEIINVHKPDYLED